MIFEAYENKRAGETRDMGWNWAPVLSSAINPTDTIASAVVVATGVSITGDNHDATTNVFRITGGTQNVEATATSTVTTSSGEIFVGVHHITITA